jgi:transcriptional regulator with GAF, ATPase, and Fis domain
MQPVIATTSFVKKPLPASRVIGASQIWQRVIDAARRVAVTDTTVFLQGESGTGKEVVAHARGIVPRRSQRDEFDGPGEVSALPAGA